MVGWCFHFTYNGVYSVPSAFASICMMVGWPFKDTYNANPFDQLLWKSLRKLKVVIKVRNFIWRCLYETIIVRWSLMQWWFPFEVKSYFLCSSYVKL